MESTAKTQLLQLQNSITADKRNKTVLITIAL